MTLNEVLDKINWIGGSNKHFVHEMFNKNNTEYIIFKGYGVLTYVNGIDEEYTMRLKTYEPAHVIEFLKDHVSDICNWNQGWMEASDDFVSKERLINEIWKNKEHIKKDYGLEAFAIVTIIEQCYDNCIIENRYNTSANYLQENDSCNYSRYVDIKKAISIFEDMANRGTLLIGGKNTTQQDLFIQICGVLMKASSSE